MPVRQPSVEVWNRQLTKGVWRSRKRSGLETDLRAISILLIEYTLGVKDFFGAGGGLSVFFTAVTLALNSICYV